MLGCSSGGGRDVVKGAELLCVWDVQKKGRKVSSNRLWCCVHSNTSGVKLKIPVAFQASVYMTTVSLDLNI